MACRPGGRWPSSNSLSSWLCRKRHCPPIFAPGTARRGPTWDCGYAAPTTRMQYTASSFADPLTRLFQPVLRTYGRTALPPGLFPTGATFHTETPDTARRHLYAPLFAAAQRAAGRVRGMQHGRLQLYVLYVALTLIALLFWALSIAAWRLPGAPPGRSLGYLAAFVLALLGALLYLTRAPNPRPHLASHLLLVVLLLLLERARRGGRVLAPWVPLVSRSWTNTVSRRLGNFQVSAQYGPLIDQMWVQ